MPSKDLSIRTPYWPHAPMHQLSEAGTYMVTAGTYHKAPVFQSRERLQTLHRGLLKYAAQYDWHLEAWAVFPNHYHFIGQPPPGSDGAESLGRMLSHFHSKAAAWVNQMDRTPGRQVWCNYWESRLTYERSYLARLNYVHQNAVRHGLVAVANEYPWCSAQWFEREAKPSMVRTVYGMKTDTLMVADEYSVNWQGAEAP